MSKRVQRIKDKCFAGKLRDWEYFHSKVVEQLPEEGTALDLGCGKGDINPFPWKEYPNVHVIGIDPDPAAECNQNIHEFHLIREDNLFPLADECVDLIKSRYVLEHISKPETFFSEVRRVLKPGGIFTFMTPNLRHPAVALARILPHSFKQKFLAKTQENIDEDDVFPAYYRLNTRRGIKKKARPAGLLPEVVEVDEHLPIAYLDFSLPTYLLAHGFYLFLKITFLKSFFGATITGTLRKPELEQQEFDK